MKQKKNAKNWLENGEIEKLNNQSQVFLVLNILEEEIKNKKDDISFLLLTIPYLYKVCNLNKEEKKTVTKKLEVIRSQIKRCMIEEKKEKNRYKVLKKLIGKIEVLLLEIKNDFDENYNNNKFELLYYLIFSIKNKIVLKNILKKAPHQLIILEEKNYKLLEEILKKYLEVLEKHTENETFSHLEELLYYEDILDILIEHNKEYLNISILQNLLNIIEEREKKEFSSIILEEKYVYFISKWKNRFLRGLKKGTLEKEERNESELDYIYEMRRSFSFSVEEQAKNIYLSTKFPKVSLDTPKVYTVDGKGAEELDDGFSCEKINNRYRLGIHITDPLAYIKESSLIMKEAKRRVSSVYKTYEMIPMFPVCLSKDLFSLNEKQVRYVASLYTEIDLESQEIIDFYPKFEPVYIEKNDTYSSCNNVMRFNDGDEDYINTLENIQRLLPFLKKFYSMDELYEKINRSEENTTHTSIIGSSMSEKIVETLMIFANSRYAKYAIENNIPCLFRNHKTTSFYKEDLLAYRKMLKDKKNSEVYLNETKILESNYPKSFYGTENLGHYGLGVSCYTHFTSPDRRIADCINMSMLKRRLNGVENQFDLENLNQCAEYINGRNSVIKSYIEESHLLRKNRKNML